MEERLLQLKGPQVNHQPLHGPVFSQALIVCDIQETSWPTS